MTRIRIVVADLAEAIFYDSTSLAAAPKEVARISDPTAHLHDRDLVTERAGRGYESFGKARHSIEREADPRYQASMRFARRIARKLDDARRNQEFDELIVVAGPPFLGLLREKLSKPTSARVVLEVHKDLVHMPLADLRRHLPTSAGELSRPH